MKIESIELSKEVYEGLGVGYSSLLQPGKPLKMRNLGQCVVIAGKNGAGKTRLLDLIAKVTNRYVAPEQRLQAEYNIAQHREAQRVHGLTLERLHGEGPRNGDPPGLEAQAQREIAAAERAVEDQLNTLALSDAFTVSGLGQPKIVPFVPRLTELTDPTAGNEQAAIRLARTFSDVLHADGANSGAPAYARQVMRAAVNERGGRNPTGSQEKRQAEEELHAILASFLGEEVRFELTEDLNLQLEGLTDRYDALLSEGQKVLFQLACMLHARHASLKGCILLLDEPENHLHPSALNDVVDRLLGLLPEGQIWVATHSVPLIAHLVAKDPDCLWFAENGKFKPAGRSPESVLDSLLGGPDGARRVNELTLLPSRFASTVFLRQCLLPPGVIGYTERDPQLTQIHQVLSGLREDGAPLCVIDFGSGRGRLLAELARAQDGRSLVSVIDYVAYEPHPAVADECQRLCMSLYGQVDGMSRSFSDLPSLLAARGGKFADVVVVCNVLHEVAPENWKLEFGGDSALAHTLKEDGYVLFVEDYALPVGERAHEYGFLLLDEEQLVALFGITEQDIAEQRFTRSNHSSPRYKGRLIAHLVSARCLKRLSPETTVRAVRALQEQSLSRLGALLASSNCAMSGSEYGRESALVTQLAANSTLWLRDRAPNASAVPSHVDPLR